MDSLNKYKEKYNHFSSWYKLYQIKREGLKVSKGELLDLLEFFKKEEEYKHCMYLKQLLDDY